MMHKKLMIRVIGMPARYIAYGVPTIPPPMIVLRIAKDA
jgi:hypothetical protein